MSSIKTTQMDGDVSIGRNVAIGGGTIIQGDAHIKGGVKVDGWLEAKNIKATNKGLFTTVEKLRAAYPLPHEGWWAIVGNTLPGSVYVVDGGKWTPTGEMGGSPTIESERYASSIAELEASMTTAKADISGHTEKIKTIEKQSSEQGVTINQTNETAVQAKELVSTLEERLTALIGNNATTAIDNFNEVIKFLAGVKDNDTLTALLAKVNERLTALEHDNNSAEAIQSVQQLVERLQSQLNLVIGENATTTIENFNEVKNFLAGLKDSDTLTALLAKVNERLNELERAKPSTDVLEVLEFDGFTDRAVAVQMESATGDFKVLFDATNKRFVAKINGQNNYSAGWLSEGEATSTDSDYQTRGSSPRPFAKKIYINRTNNTLYRWNGEELVQVGANLGNVINEIYFESDAFKLGYFDNLGKNLTPHNSHSCIKINVEKYRDCEVKLDVEVLADRSGFINDKEQVTRLAITGNKAKIPNDAISLFVTYAKSNTTAKLSILQKLSVDEAFRMKLNTSDAEQKYISKELLKNQIRTNPENNLIGYIKSDNTLVNSVGFHGIRLDVKAFRGGKAMINKPYMSGNLSTTGFVLENGETQWVKDIIVNKKNVLKIPENAVTLWNTWRDEDARTEEQFIELEKIDNNLASKSYVEDELKRNAEEIKSEINQRSGVQKLPQSTLWYVLGDSITAASVAKGEHYYELVAKRNNLKEGTNYISIARDGAKVTYSTSYGGSQLTEIPKINKNTTLITLLLGINDFQFNSPLGTCWRVEGKELIDIPESAEACTTFSKAVVYMVSNLIKRCPKATIAWILPLRKRGVRKNSNGDYLEDFWKVITDVCEYFSCPIIKIAKESTLLNPNNENSGAFGDGVHPNKLGNLIMSYLIENQLSLLVPNKQSVNSTTLSGKIVDSVGKAVDISLKFASGTGSEIQTPAGYGGAFSVELEKGVNYTISSNGYTINPSSIAINGDTIKNVVVSRN